MLASCPHYEVATVATNIAWLDKSRSLGKLHDICGLCVELASEVNSTSGRRGEASICSRRSQICPQSPHISFDLGLIDAYVHKTIFLLRPLCSYTSVRLTSIITTTAHHGCPAPGAAKGNRRYSTIRAESNSVGARKTGNCILV